MAPMHRAGTTVVLEDEAESRQAAAAAGTLAGQMSAAGAQARSAAAALPQPRLGAVVAAAGPGAPVPLTTAGVPSSRTLPCTDDPDLFFAESPEDVEYAKEMCRGCPARAACLAGALERREPWGVWGGELFLRGEIVPRKRPRGRPRKDDVAA
jgi:WhiB family transcriptional regulator, redox-sensing transcriptional regulator